MAELGSNEIQAIVDKVVKRLGGTTTRSTGAATGGGVSSMPEMSGRGLFPDVDSAVSAARRAFEIYSTVPLETRKRMIANVRRRCTEWVEVMSRLAVEETGLGRLDPLRKRAPC